MCGITGIIQTPNYKIDLGASLSRMGSQQIHRGPDANDFDIVELDAKLQLGIGHQRLSIFDLSSNGNQPMKSPDGRYHFIFNGEIFNHIELRQELGESPILDISDGDTAVALEALSRWGFDALNKFNGMWAFALYDKKTKLLFLSRDRMGIKPLNYCIKKGRMAFGSEVKSILQAFPEKFQVNPREVRDYLLNGRTNNNCETFFKDIYSIPPGSMVTIDLNDQYSINELNPRSYWRHPYELNEPIRETSSEEVRELFLDVVKQHLRADVPVGVTLSGGLDSSAIIGAAKHLNPDYDITALSVVSDDASVSEEKFQKIVVDATGCKWNKLNISRSPQKALDSLDEVAWFSDSPAKSFSDVGLLELCRAARNEGIIVLLNGQGADEQLAGYKKYLFFYASELLRQGNFLKALVLLTQFWRNGTILNQFQLAEAKRYLPGRKLVDIAQPLGERLIQVQPEPLFSKKSFRAREYDDMTKNSVPMLLHAEDRLSMASSLEMRVPFLDYRLVELFAKVGANQKLNQGWTKAIFRDAMTGLVPIEITRRKDKKGFTLPQDRWLRHELAKQTSYIFSGPMLIHKFGLVDQFKLISLHNSFLAGDRRVSSREVLRYVSLERWLHVFSEHLTP